MTLQAEVDGFLAHAERGDAHEAVAGVLSLHDSGLACSDIVAEVLAPVQLEVGARWATGQWSVADEHVTTAVVDEALGALAARLEPRGGRTMALCSAEGEWHVTPLRMGALVLRDLGWEVRLLGASTPPSHLRSTLQHLQADVAVVQCSLPTNLFGVPDVVAVAHEAGLPVIAAGRGFGPDDHRATRLGCEGWAPDPRAGARLAEAWLDAPPPSGEVVQGPRHDEMVALRQHQAEVVDRAIELLEAGLPAMAAYDDRQRDHTRRDLHHVLDAVAATMLVDDERILHDFLAWLELVLAPRGVPATAVTAGLDALAEAAGADHPGVGVLLGDAVRA